MGIKSTRLVEENDGYAFCSHHSTKPSKLGSNELSDTATLISIEEFSNEIALLGAIRMRNEPIKQIRLREGVRVSAPVAGNTANITGNTAGNYTIPD